MHLSWSLDIQVSFSLVEFILCFCLSLLRSIISCVTHSCYLLSFVYLISTSWNFSLYRVGEIGTFSLFLLKFLIYAISISVVAFRFECKVHCNWTKYLEEPKFNKLKFTWIGFISRYVILLFYKKVICRGGTVHQNPSHIST